MAVAFDAVGPSSAGAGTTTTTTATSATWTHTVGASGNAIVVGVAVGTSTAGITATATCGGVAMTSLGKVGSNGATTGYVQLFGLVNPGAGAKSMVVTLSAAATISAGSVSFTGAGSFGTAVTAFGNSTAAAVTVAGTGAGNMVVDALCTGTATAPTTTKTSRWVKATNSATASGVGAQATSVSAAGSVAMGWTVATDFWGMAAAEVIASAAVAAAPRPPALNINQSVTHASFY